MNKTKQQVNKVNVSQLSIFFKSEKQKKSARRDFVTAKQRLSGLNCSNFVLTQSAIDKGYKS